MLLTEKPKAASTAAAWEGEIVVIEPRHPWRQLGIGEIWSHRELPVLLHLAGSQGSLQADSIRSGLGAVLQPVLLMLVFSVSLGRLPGVGPSGVPYPLFVFAGLVPWTLFASSLTGASESLTR
jgi:lipopolysaccharide transport system permease protein